MFIAAHNGAHVWGGAERGTSLLLAGLKARGHDVLLFCNDGEVAARARALGVPAEVLPLGGDLALPHALRFALHLHRRSPDVLLLGTFRKIWLGALAGRIARVPQIVVRIGLETDTPRNPKYRLVLTHLVDTVVLKADDLRGRFLAALPGVEEGRIVTIAGGVEARTPTRPPGSLRAEFGIPADAILIGSVGRLVRQKRFDRFIGALARVPGAPHGLIVGEGEEGAELEALAERLGMADRVHFTGHREDIGDVLASLDIFVVSSDREMLSFAMLEAMMAGVPVVSTPVSGALEAIGASPDGATPPGAIADFSEMSLARAMESLAANGELRRSMGDSAADRARVRFSFDRSVAEWERLLLNGARGKNAESR